MKKCLAALLLSFAALLALSTAVCAAEVCLSTQDLAVDSVVIACEKYNVDGSNYFRLRDLAYLLNGSDKQFSVGYSEADNVVSLTAGEPYTPDRSELDLSGGDRSESAVQTAQTICIDGQTRRDLSVYNIGGSNYFKLRELGEALGFPVGYDEETRTALIDTGNADTAALFRYADVADYAWEACAEVNGNDPFFSGEEDANEPFEQYSETDALGRCGAAFANVCLELMPTEKRGSISSVHPTGWHSVSYDFVEGKSLYNRCHLIGFQLTGENANRRNLITGTRYLNVTGMLPFEDLTADCVKKDGCHVLYRVTPIFIGGELVARGVLMEGLSVEDAGESVCFCVFAYNVQPGVEIDYLTGESAAEEETEPPAAGEKHFILNVGSMKFHLPDCPDASGIAERNRAEYDGGREEILALGYSPCGRCKP